MLENFDLAKFAKFRVAFKTVLIQIALFFAILFIMWSSQRIYAVIDPVVFPNTVILPDSMGMTERQKGKVLIDSITYQMRRELNSTFGWTMNDLLFNIYVLDNRSYRQYGVYHATKVLIDLFSMHISKIGTNGRESDFLYTARLNNFVINPRKFWFPSAEGSYKEGLDLVEQYKKSLDDGTGTYNAKTDDTCLALEVVIGENLLGYAIGLLEDAQNLPFYTLDNRIYEVQGLVLVCRDFVHALYTLYPEIATKNNTDNISAAMQDLDAICTYDPMYISAEFNCGELVLSHLIFARNRLTDVRDSIKM